MLYKLFYNRRNLFYVNKGKTMTRNYLAFSVLALGLCFSTVASAQNTELKQILTRAFAKDPELLEAKANTMIAHNQTEQAISEHYPTLSVFGRQSFEDYSRYNDNDRRRFTPGAQASINVYSFGAIEKKVAYSEANESSFRYKYDETKENIAYRITELYLMAIRSKDSIAAQQRGLTRLRNIIGEIEAIADNDEGRRSELVQAEARIFAVEQQQNAAERELQDALSQLQRYSGKVVKSSGLADPFKALTSSELKQRYTQNQYLHPSYQTAKAKIKSAYAGVEAEKASRLPKVDLIGQATEDDRQVYLNVSWNMFDRASSYSVQEKAQTLEAEKSRLERTVLDLEEKTRTALINLDEYRRQINTLSKQVSSLYEVTNYYKLQFQIAKRSLLDLLNAENELLNAELSRVSAEYQLRHSVLDYLYSQGMTTKWATELK